MYVKTMKILPLIILTVLVFGACTTTGKQRHAGKSGMEVEYRCPVCDTGFMSEREWQSHVRRHHSPHKQGPVAQAKECPKTGKAMLDFECPVCDTGFITAREYSAHVRQHHPDDPVMQPDVRIKRTSRTRMGKKVDYSCPVCGTGYVDPVQWEHERKTVR